MNHSHPNESKCPHKTCGNSPAEQPANTLFSIGESVGAFCHALIRILKIIAPLLRNYNKTVARPIIVTVDYETEVWKDPVIKSVMDKVIRFYNRFKIKITYTVERRNGIKSVKASEIITPATSNTLFLVDSFSDCPNCQLRGYENKRHITVRYHKNNQSGGASSYLWTTVAHEIGHHFGLDHGGSRENLMRDFGPNSDLVDKVKLTVCQVGKIKK